MEKITTIGLDLAKNVFQVHGIDAAGEVVLRRKLAAARSWNSSRLCRRRWSAWRRAAGRTYWARELAPLGHEVRLMPPAYVKPYVKRGKTDAADAEAICEAVTRPTMRFVPAKTEAQQASRR